MAGRTADVMRRWATLAVVSAGLFASSTSLHAHCQVPCGIYHDHDRFHQMEEMIQTFTKAVHEIEDNDLSTAEERNQLVRWVNVKDEEADHFAEIVTKYFLQQRIKAEDPQYQEKLTTAHKLLVLAMKVKQTVDQDVVNSLQQTLVQFEQLVMGKEGEQAREPAPEYSKHRDKERPGSIQLQP